MKSLYCFHYCKLLFEELTCGPEVIDTKSFIQINHSLSGIVTKCLLAASLFSQPSQQYCVIMHLYFPLQSASASNKNATCTQEYINLRKFSCISLVFNLFTIRILSEQLTYLC
jgi:hypothetical protein